jgi:dTDP-4-dehydrorhamnose 3,5-epimerase
MNVIKTKLAGAVIFEPKVFGDDRGFFLESFNAKQFSEIVAQSFNFVQDNHSRSSQNVLRGLHYQTTQPQGKLVRVVSGEVFDVAVDLRRSSPSFGQWEGVLLSESNKRQFWIPPGFAHGFVVLSETADFLYKTTDYYAPSHECCIKWDDQSVGIEWPKHINPILSAKDNAGLAFEAAPKFD